LLALFVLEWVGLKKEIVKRKPLIELSVELLANAMRSSSDSLLIKDLAGTIVIASQGVADFYQCDVDDLPGRNVYENLPDSLAALIRDGDQRVIQTGHEISGEESWDFGHEKRAVLVSRSPIHDERGAVIGVHTSYKNISAIKQAFEYFEQNRQRFIALAETCPVGIFECNPFHQLTYVNPEWERITGLDSIDVLGRHWTDFVVPQQKSLVQHWIDRENSHTGADRIDLQIQGKQECTVELSLNRVVNSDEQTVSFIGSIVDLTFRLAAQKELREKASLLRDLTSSVPAIIWQLAVDGQCIFVSEHWVEVTGKSIQDALGNIWENFTHEEDLPNVTQQLNNVLSQRQQTASFEFRLRCRGDEWRWMLATCQQIHTVDGTFMGIAGNSVDITDRRQAEIQLQQNNLLLEERVRERTRELSETNDSLRNEIDTRILAEELLEEKRAQVAHFSRMSIMGRLSGELAHELNQPLNAIRNYVASLAKILESHSIPPAATSVLDLLNSEITRAANIIRRTREFVSTGKHQLEDLKLSNLVADTVAMLKGEARRRGMHIRVSDDEGDSSILGDSVRLQQVLVNLVLNALDSMMDQDHSDKTVHIELKNSIDRHTISVHDSGCGVSGEEQAKLFDAFFTTKSSGLGMGLAISRDIVEDHGGTLTYQPRERGSTFVMDLPK
jgi:PAS domain S-box-containing protein